MLITLSALGILLVIAFMFLLGVIGFQSMHRGRHDRN